MTHKGEIGTTIDFQRREYDICYWKIDNFSSVSEKAAQNVSYESPYLNFKNLGKCWLNFYPNGVSDKTGIIGLILISKNPPARKCVYLTMGLKTHSGRIEKWFSNYIIINQNETTTIPAFIQKSEFLKRKEKMVLSDCLTVVVFLSQEALNIIQDVDDQTETDGHAEKSGEQEKKGVEKVAWDIAKLLVSGEGSDATIVVQGVECKVHSCILAARTPVFAALFKHDTLEKETRKVTISDCEPVIFREFLAYVYSGSVQDLTAEKALGLYVVADKYLIQDLKEECRQCIQGNLSLETLCQAVRSAILCKDEGLLESAILYFAMNFKDALKSVEWQTYIEENPREANEVLIRASEFL